MMKQLKKYLDKTLEKLWIFITIIIKISYQTLTFIIFNIYKLLSWSLKFKFLGIFGKKSIKFLNQISNFFTSGLYSSFKNRIKGYYEQLDKWLKESKIGRRIFFSVMVTLLLFYLHPPSHWGPWHEYQKGTASYYGPGFYYKTTASGEIFKPGTMTAAHKKLPLGSYILVKNNSTGKKIVVRVNDRGPFTGNRVLDLSEYAATKLGFKEKGLASITIYTKIKIK